MTLQSNHATQHKTKQQLVDGTHQIDVGTGYQRIKLIERFHIEIITSN